jgi:hypothetical protein
VDLQQRVGHPLETSGTQAPIAIPPRDSRDQERRGSTFVPVGVHGDESRRRDGRLVKPRQETRLARGHVGFLRDPHRVDVPLQHEALETSGGRLNVESQNACAAALEDASAHEPGSGTDRPDGPPDRPFVVRVGR